MSKELKQKARALSEQIASGEAEIREGKAGLKAMLSTAAEEGTIGTADFNAKFEEASKPVDALAEQVEEKRRSWASIMELIGEPSINPLTVQDSGVGVETPSGWGDRFVKSDVYKALRASGRLDQKDSPIGQTDGVRVTNDREQVRALLTSGDYPLMPQRESEIVALPQEALTILDLISTGTTDTEVVEWVTQTLRTNAAASVAEGAAAPESAYEWDVVQTQVQEVAHFHASTKRAMRDEGQLRSMIDDEMMSGLRLRVQNLVVGGDGLGTNFKGIYNTTGVLEVEFDALEGDKFYADTIHRAVTAIRIAGLGAVEPTVIGIHPNDFEKHALSKDKNDNYINGGPNGNGPSTIWGLKPVVHVAFNEGLPLIGDYRQAKLWIWSDVALSMTDAHEDFFRKRLVAAMASFGGAFGVKRAYAFATANLSGA